jgi:hypothetical protein
LALIAAGLALVGLLAPEVPRSQEFRVVLDPEGASSDRVVDLQVEALDETPEAGVRLRVPAGQSRITHTMRLRPGEYVLKIRVDRLTSKRAASRPTRKFRLALEGQPITLYSYGRK